MNEHQILALQSYILACVRYECAHHSEKSEALMGMILAQERMRDALLVTAPTAPGEHVTNGKATGTTAPHSTPEVREA